MTARPENWTRPAYDINGKRVKRNDGGFQQFVETKNYSVPGSTAGVFYISMPASLQPADYMIEVPIWPNHPKR